MKKKNEINDQIVNNAKFRCNVKLNVIQDNRNASNFKGTKIESYKKMGSSTKFKANFYNFESIMDCKQYTINILGNLK